MYCARLLRALGIARSASYHGPQHLQALGSEFESCGVGDAFGTDRITSMWSSNICLVGEAELIQSSRTLFSVSSLRGLQLGRK